MKFFASVIAARASMLLIATMFVSIVNPAIKAHAAPANPILISSFVDTAGSININAGKGEGIQVGSKGIILQDGKKIADYEVVQVNWGFSKIQLSNLVEGYSVKPGDSAPIIEAPPAKKSSGSKSTMKIVALIAAAAAVALLAKGGGGGGGGGSAGAITLNATKTTTPDKVVKVTITANVKDASGNPAADGTLVIFSSSAGTLDYSQVPTVSGRASVVLTADDADTAVVTVKALGQTSTINVSFISSIDLVAEPTTIQVSGSGGSVTQSTITAVCRDAFGELATSGEVEFTASFGTVTPATASINGSGVATTTFTSNSVGTATITAKWSKSTVTTPITVTAGPPHSMTVTTSANTLACDGSSTATIRATVRDIQGNLVKDGTVVNFSVIPDGDGGGNGTITAQAATSNGVATAYLVTRDASGATSKAGTATVKAEVRAANQPANVPAPLVDITKQDTLVQFISLVVGRIVLTANPVNIRGWDVAGNASTITATVYNEDNQPIPNGTVVTFAANHGTITPSATTSNGSATATLTSDASGDGTWNGLVDVTATAGGVSKTASGIVVFSGPAVAANTTTNISQSSLPAVGGQATITCTVRDINNNAVVDGTQVTASTDKGSVSPVTSHTSTGGVVVFNLATSTSSGFPTQTGPGSVTLTITTGGAPVVITVPFTVVP
jgi:hypothetical protein